LHGVKALGSVSGCVADPRALLDVDRATAASALAF